MKKLLPQHSQPPQAFRLCIASHTLYTERPVEDWIQCNGRQDGVMRLEVIMKINESSPAIYVCSRHLTPLYLSSSHGVS